MTAKRPTRVPRTEQERSRRRQLLEAASGWLGYGGPISIQQVREEGDCGDTEPAPAS